MARIFIDVPEARRNEILRTVSKEAEPLAKVLLTGTGTGGALGTGFIDFLLTNVQENFTEKFQITDTLTDNYVVYFSGREPTMCSYSGVLLNTYQDDQRVWMLRLYSELLRGTRLATRNIIARIRYDSLIVSGYLTDLRLGLEGATDHNASQFSFNLIAKRIQIVTPTVSQPTILATAVTTDGALDSSENLARTQTRAGDVTAETPPTARTAPAAEVVAATNAATRAALRAKGLSDSQIVAVMARSMEISVRPEVDPREQQNTQAQQGAQRVYDLVKGTDPSKTNPDNISNDAAGGRTNILGSTNPEAQPLVARNANRTRGSRAFHTATL
jgi:hypothetical protein